MKILIIEDNQVIAKNISDYLQTENYVVCIANDGEKGYDMIEQVKPDLIILDRMLPSIDWLSIARMLRNRSNNIPILFLTALGKTIDKIEGLEIGVDDYLVKPFDLEELSLRIKNILTRVHWKEIWVIGQIFKFDDITISLKSHRIDKKWREIILSPKEFAIVEYLLKNKWTVITKNQIFEEVWKYYSDDFSVFSNTLTVHLAYIRKKLWVNIIRTVKQVWYIID